jgi:probable HAF family extracellular repeat protein
MCARIAVIASSADMAGNMKSISKVVVLVAWAILVTACGGGGGGGNSGDPPAPTTYSIGGTIAGLAGTVVLQNNGGDDLTLSTDSGFTFATRATNGSDYTVTVLTQPAGQTCHVSNGSGTTGNANVTSVRVGCVLTVTDYTVIQLDPLPGDHRANAEDINDLGQIVGWSLGETTGQVAVLWSIDQAGVVTVKSLGRLPGGTFSYAMAINNNAQVIGFADGASGTRRPFIWTEIGGMRDLGLPVGLVGGQAHEINDNGQVVGAVFESEFSSLTEQGRFAIWRVDGGGAVIDIRDLGTLGGIAAAPWDNNVHGNVTGSIWLSAASQTAFFWSELNGVTEIDGDEGLGINDNDKVVGFRGLRGNPGFVWTASVGLTEILNAVPLSINNSSQAAGRANIGFGHAFIWEDGEVKYLPMPENRDFSEASSINEAGWIVGWSTDVDGNEYANLWRLN